MDESLEILYFEWLYAKIHLVEIPYNTYSKLLHLLYTTEFVWLLPGDDNRMEDGKDLRLDFIRESGLALDISWFDDGCSVLEMLVGFSRRASFQTDIPEQTWFWRFISNLGLADATDDEFDPQGVELILSDFVWRTYDYDGFGGLFPLQDPREDQRGVEIWYQFCEYIIENETSI